MFLYSLIRHKGAFFAIPFAILYLQPLVTIVRNLLKELLANEHKQGKQIEKTHYHYRQESKNRPLLGLYNTDEPCYKSSDAWHNEANAQYISDYTAAFNTGLPNQDHDQYEEHNADGGQADRPFTQRSFWQTTKPHAHHLPTKRFMSRFYHCERSKQQPILKKVGSSSTEPTLSGRFHY